MILTIYLSKQIIPILYSQSHEGVPQTILHSPKQKYYFCHHDAAT
jgi:hypothetical protein